MLISVSDYKHSEGVTQLIINVEEYFSVSYSSEKSTLCVIVVGLFRGQTGCDVSARFPALLPAFSKSGTAVLYIESLSCPLWMLSEGANVPELPITLSSAAVDTPLLCFSCHKLQQLLQAVAVWVGAGIQALLCFFWTFGFLNLACLFLSQIPPQGI
ncbi:uncharacterized [Tachysurus ichikawai]